MATDRLLRLVTDDWESHRDACWRQIAFFGSPDSCPGMSDADRVLAIDALRDVAEAYSRLLINHERRQAKLRAMAQEPVPPLPYPGPPAPMNGLSAKFAAANRPE